MKKAYEPVQPLNSIGLGSRQKMYVTSVRDSALSDRPVETYKFVTLFCIAKSKRCLG